MKIRRSKEHLVFDFGPREGRIVLDILKLYPRMPVSHHQLSKSNKVPDRLASQKLLEDAVREQREVNRRELENLLNDPARFASSKSGTRLTLTAGEIEWLLQVLNDIRVGSWVLLGSPDPKLEPDEATPEEARLYLEMELAGVMEMHLLAAMDGGA